MPELYDDLLDEWTHAAHIEEPNRTVLRFQRIAEEKKVRTTFLVEMFIVVALVNFKRLDHIDQH